MLVFLVVYVFLQSLRATLIPAITIPVSLIGTFALHAGARLLDQHAHALRTGARDRSGRGRRDRRGRERRARIMRGRRAPPRSDACARWREVTGADRRGPLVLVAVFVPGRVPARHHRAALPAVRADARRARSRSPRSTRSRSRRRSARCCCAPRAAAQARARLFAPSTAASAASRAATSGSARASLGAGRSRCSASSRLLARDAAVLYRACRRGFVPAEDQGYFIVERPAPRRRLARAHRATSRSEDPAMRCSRRPACARGHVIGGFNALAGTQHRRTSSACFVILEPWDERRARAALDAASSRACAPQLAAIPGRARAAASTRRRSAGLGTHGRLRAPGSRTRAAAASRSSRAVTAGADRRGATRRASVTGLVSTLPRERAADRVDLDRDEGRRRSASR